MRFLDEDVQYHDPPAYRRHIDSSRNSFRRRSAQLPKLALEMFHMRFAKPLQADLFDHLHQTNQPCPQTGWESGDFIIDNVA